MRRSKVVLNSSEIRFLLGLVHEVKQHKGGLVVFAIGRESGDLLRGRALRIRRSNVTSGS
jgi:hypothetical protein